jgi:small neutral amino acid transporter SnatA (MarC family)
MFAKIIRSTGSRNIAAIVGSFLATVALTISITLLWPFGNLAEQVLAGGTFFFIFWASIFYWATLSQDGLQAWIRVFILLVPALAIDIISLAS